MLFSLGAYVGDAIESHAFELSDEVALRSLACRLLGVNELGQQFKIDGFVDVRLSGSDLVDINI